MSNTIGTILRALVILGLLASGWFFLCAALAYGASLAVNTCFRWDMAWALFGGVVLFRALYPRGVFSGYRG